MKAFISILEQIFIDKTISQQAFEEYFFEIL